MSGPVVGGRAPQIGYRRGTLSLVRKELYTGKPYAHHLIDPRNFGVEWVCIAEVNKKVKDLTPSEMVLPFDPAERKRSEHYKSF